MKSVRFSPLSSISKSFTQPVQQIAQVTNMLQSTAAASERVFEFLEEKEEEQTVAESGADCRIRRVR